MKELALGQLGSSTRCRNMDRKRKPAAGAAEVHQKEKKPLLADVEKCAKIRDLFKQSAGGDEDGGEETETSEWSEQGAGCRARMYRPTCFC